MKQEHRKKYLRMALWLVAGTLVYNVVEAILALWFGMAAKSVALVGFGLDSVIETAAASIVLWRLRLERLGAPAERLASSEHGVHRFVGATFFALAAYVTLEAGFKLWGQKPPAESLPGIILALASVLIMPLVSLAKLRTARALGSRSLEAEAKETLACSYLSLTLLLGLGLHSLLGWWWADPAAALAMVPWLIHEGWEGWRCGEGG